MTAQRTTPPFRAEHLGSFKRPEAVITKRKEYEQGKCSSAELAMCEDEAIAEVVKLQKDMGLRTITDGEFRRKFFWEGMLNKADGMTFVPQNPPEKFSQMAPARYIKTQPADTWICTEKLRRTKALLGLEFEYLKTLVGRDEVANIKMTISPPSYFQWSLGDKKYIEGVYEHDGEYWQDVIEIYRQEIADLYERGCRVIQIDDPYLTFFADPSFQERMAAANISTEDQLSKMIQVLNRCLEGRKEDMCVGIHLCRGNATDGTYYATGSYETLAARLFKELNVDVFYLEFDNERSGDFQPLRHFPPNKLLVLGVISTKVAKLERPDDLKRRIYEAADIMAESTGQTREQALDRICISPQCGFASVMLGNRFVSQEDLRKKVNLLTTVADDIWK
ncbi:UROD/MetE-like protein [Stereum hirsutum FP-91666 SS1]|uniref:UROD/MetE-like protein n=1 Tax=Stereum hirsutum (strain FP-91666) TaxID=721885 RepID=UPI000444A8BF|nr:UROD/MetE-like protein [Stereum hirsutum FP-91666 SS1]EIM81743.1 UROD/MetE-like protein [Stereum hirsutum FP-91666 SS1]